MVGGRWSVVSGWSVGGAFVLRRYLLSTSSILSPPLLLTRAFTYLFDSSVSSIPCNCESPIIAVLPLFRLSFTLFSREWLGLTLFRSVIE